MSVLRRVPIIVVFTFYFLWKLTLANLRVAWDVARQNKQIRPAIVAVETAARTDAEITLLAILVSLTPGTLVIDVSSNRRFLYLHVLYLSEAEDFVGFEKFFMRMFR
jgi:multicomponent Na+:H+ antiporter subunit E